MRIVVAAVALAPFVLALVGMVTGRVRIQPCCPPTASDEGETPRPRTTTVG